MKKTLQFLATVFAVISQVYLWQFEADAQDQRAPLLVKEVTIVDVETGQAIPGQSILTEGDKVARIARFEELEIPVNATVIDGKGKFAIPGLWDMHIHWYDQKTMALFPINGVTGVRLMWGTPFHTMWRTQFGSGEKFGPRIHMAGPIIDGPNPIWPGSLVADSEDSAKKAVGATIRLKADFAKVYSLLPRDAYFAIANECKEKGLPFSGHVPRMVSAREASMAGQHSIEHLYEILIACSSEEDELRKMIADHVAENDNKIRAAMSLSSVIHKRALESFDKSKAEELFKTFAKNETWQCPTLTVLRNMAYLTEDEVQNNKDLKYFTGSIKRMLAPKEPRWEQTEEQIKAAQREYDFRRKLLPAMHKLGVPIIAGTDVLNPFCLPGFSLHGELELLVESGLEPKVALQAATINAAKFMRKQDELGSIKVGKLADIVLLDANPLEDISNTRKICEVIYQGVRFDRSALDQRLADFEKAAIEE